MHFPILHCFLHALSGRVHFSVGMVKKTSDTAVYVTGIGLDATFESLRDLFSSVGNIKVSIGLLVSLCILYL